MKATTFNFGKLVALGLLAGSTFVANAATGPFKMALPENGPAADAIKAGQYQQAVIELNNSATDLFSKQISLCVAHTQLSQFALAEKACSQAIVTARRLEGETSSNKREMRALAFSNRGVTRLLMQDPVAALEDFEQAQSLSSTEYGQYNLSLLQQKLKAAVVPVLTAAN